MSNPQNIVRLTHIIDMATTKNGVLISQKIECRYCIVTRPPLGLNFRKKNVLNRIHHEGVRIFNKIFIHS